MSWKTGHGHGHGLRGTFDHAPHLEVTQAYIKVQWGVSRGTGRRGMFDHVTWKSRTSLQWTDWLHGHACRPCYTAMASPRPHRPLSYRSWPHKAQLHNPRSHTRWPHSPQFGHGHTLVSLYPHTHSSASQTSLPLWPDSSESQPSASQASALLWVHLGLTSASHTCWRRK